MFTTTPSLYVDIVFDNRLAYRGILIDFRINSENPLAKDYYSSHSILIPIQESEGNNRTQTHILGYNRTQPHPLGYDRTQPHPLGCSIRVTPVDDIEGSMCTATLMEGSGEEPSPYCLCSCRRSQTVQFTCIITESTFEGK